MKVRREEVHISFLLFHLKKGLVLGEIQKNSNVWLKNLLSHSASKHMSMAWAMD